MDPEPRVVCQACKCHFLAFKTVFLEDGLLIPVNRQVSFHVNGTHDNQRKVRAFPNGRYGIGVLTVTEIAHVSRRIDDHDISIEHLSHDILDPGPRFGIWLIGIGGIWFT